MDSSEKYGAVKSKWIRRIKVLLGASKIISLEISDEDISELIDTAFDLMEPYITDMGYITKPYCNRISLEGENVGEVLSVIPSQQLMVTGLSATDEMMFDFQAYHNGKVDPLSVVRRAVTPDVNIPFKYDAETKSLYVSEGYTTGNITIEVSTKVDIESLRDERAKQWIFEYSLALAKEVVGRIRSKVKSSNVPIELDGEILLNEASSEKSNLEQRLASEQFGPPIVLR